MDATYPADLSRWDTKRLTELLTERCRILDAEWKRQTDDHNDSVYRNKAETAFRSKEYAKAIEAYEKIPPERRTQIDDFKLRLARKYSG
jgi:hypothetical protein